MKPPILFALALMMSTGALAQEPARQNDMALKATEVPSTIDFQGRLHDSGGSPVNATLSIKFSLYDVGSGGTALWTETKSVQVTDGLFQVKLGEITPFTPDHFSGSDRWLGIQVGAEAEMSPAPGSQVWAMPCRPSRPIPPGPVTPIQPGISEDWEM